MSSNEIHGHIASVTQTFDGAITNGAAAVGATVLTVDDVADFIETGGWLTIQNPDGSFAAAVAYTGVDDTASTITLASGLATAVADGTALRATDSTGASPTEWFVTVVDDSDGSTVTAPLTHTLITLLGDGIRALVSESAVVTRDGDGEWTVTEIIGKTPVQNGAYIDPTTLPDPIPVTPPATSPTLTVQGLTSSFLITAADVAQTTSIQYHISTAAGFTPGPATLALTTRATVVAINQMPDASPLAQGNTYYFKAVATNTAGSAAPSAQVSATLTQITATQISDGAISTPKLAAGAITADVVTGGTFQSAYTVTGSIKVGNITLSPGGTGDPGGLYIPLSSGGFIRLPADGSDADVQCNLHALSAVIDNNLVIHGSGNDIAGTVTLDNVPTAPKVAPTVTSLLLRTGAGFQAHGSNPTLSADRLAGADATNLYVFSTGGTMWAINKSTGASSMLFGGITGDPMSATRHGTGWAVLVGSPSSAASQNVQIYDASGTMTGSFAVWTTSVGGFGFSAIGSDGTNVLVAGPRSAGSTTNKVYTYTNAGAQVGSAVTLATPTFTASDPVMPQTVSVGSFDYGASRYVVSLSDQTTRVYSTTGTEQAANLFASTTSTVQGSAWDGTAFWLMVAPSGSDDYDLRKLSSRATSVSRTVKYTQFCDGTRAGNHGTRETKASPTATVTQRVRSYLQVVTPPPADGGSADDPNAVRVYVDSHLQSTLTSTSGWSVGYDTTNTASADSPTTEGWVGVAGLTVALGSIVSQATDANGPLFQVDGLGGGGWQAVMPAGAVLPYAASAAPAGFLLCDGSAVSRTTYARLFATIGTTYGAGDGSTTFNVPNMADRMPVGVSGTKALGSAGGAASVTLAAANLPNHTHTIGVNYQSTTTTGGTAIRVTDVANTTGGTGTLATGNTGNGGFANTAVNIQNPYRALNFIIKV